jgi:hypothetical protein
MQRHNTYYLLTASVILSVLLSVLGANQACADRVVLSPEGIALAPNAIRSEFEISPYLQNGNIAWLQYSLPEGIELEMQRYDVLPDRRSLYALNVQYPLFPDIGNLPALSLGVRDLLGTGNEHRSFYVATTKAFGLSDRQMKVLRDFRISAGFGTERMDGLFIGLQARFALGVSLYAEYYQQRPNVSIALPLVRNLQARATSLNGNIFYGLSFTVRR